MTKEALSNFHNRVCKERGIKPPGFHSIKYFIGTKRKSKLLKFDLEEAQDLEAHVKGTILQDFYDIEKFLKQMEISKKWQKILWDQEGLKELKEYLSNRKNFEITHSQKKKREKEPVKEDIIKEINRIYKNNKILDVNKVAKYFKVSKNYVYQIIRIFFNGPEFANLKIRKALAEEEKNKILEDIKVNVENKVESWSRIAERYGVHSSCVSRLYNANFVNRSWKLELYKELKLKFLNKSSKNAVELAKQFNRSKRTIQSYIRRFNIVIFLDVLFSFQREGKEN